MRDVFTCSQCNQDATKIAAGQVPVIFADIEDVISHLNSNPTHAVIKALVGV